jgi:hypothetical protein
MMNKQYEIGETAHLARAIKVNGILNYNTEKENYKRLSLKFQEGIKIKNYRRIDDSFGGYGYDCEVAREGELYRVENVAQSYLYSKVMWQKTLELKEKIETMQQLEVAK